MSNISSLNRFVMNPTNLDISRSRFNRPHTHKTTFKSGKLIPIYLDEVLPGDTFDVDLSSVVRMLTPAVPVLDNAYLDVYFFFVPNRLATLHDGDWQKICGENTGGYWASEEEHSLKSTGNYVPWRSILVGAGGAAEPGITTGSALNYLGLPIFDKSSADIWSDTPFIEQNGFNLMPVIAYVKIWNEFFRDQNTQPPITITSNLILNNDLHRDTLNVNRLHDYFTSALPSPQKGNPVLIPLGEFAPVVTPSASPGNAPVNTSPVQVSTVAGPLVSGSVSVGNVSTDNIGGLTSNNNTNIVFKNLVADLSQASSTTINQLRQAFAIQKLLERDARGGTRYREMLKSHFGVTIPDASVQVPEYLGGKRIPLNITQVLQTSETSDISPLGATGAFSNTSFSDSMFIKSFTEYGYIMGVACVRTAQSYSQGIPKLFTRNRRYDFYYPVFANLGEQPIYERELYVPHRVSNVSVDIQVQRYDGVFGYQEAWAEYRYHPNLVTGNLAPNSEDATLTPWTYTNKFDFYPTLNRHFMVQPPEQIGDTLVVTDTATQFVADFYFDVKTTRPMPLYSIPGLIDHH